MIVVARRLHQVDGRPQGGEYPEADTKPRAGSDEDSGHAHRREVEVHAVARQRLDEREWQNGEGDGRIDEVLSNPTGENGAAGFGREHDSEEDAEDDEGTVVDLAAKVAGNL